jgi:superfamily I DNA/RNA helicase
LDVHWRQYAAVPGKDAVTADLSSLNSEQRAAVTHTEGALLVLAGAGSGKTRVIAARIAHLVRARRVPPEAILAVTFTNKAAREMLQRVGPLMPGKERPTICTFHSFGVRLLRVHIGLLGYRPGFAIFDTQDQLSVVRTIVEEGGHDSLLLKPQEILFAIGQAKGKGVPAAELLSHTGAPSDVLVGTVLQAYEGALKRMNALDFEDILILAQRLCRDFPEPAQQFFSAYRYVLVDEYQDTNRTQYELLRHIVRGHGNLCVVGDDDQSIYGWRGAAPGNILEFEQGFPGARIVRLEQNYRSTDAILNAANQVIRHNAKRREKLLRGTQGPGQPLLWLLGEDERDEVEKVVTHLKLARLREGGTWSDSAILYRSNHQSRLIEELLREEGIPYRLVGGVRFYERKEVKDALAYLRLVHNPRDEVSLYRVLNYPRRGIGQASQLKIAEYAAHQHRPPFDLLKEGGQYADFHGAVATSMERFTQLIERYGQRFAAEALGPTFRDLLAELSFHRTVEKEHDDAKGRERAVQLVLELELAVDQFGRTHEGATLKDYLEHVALFTFADDTDAAQRTPQVTLMTVHSAKGLEFPTVYLVNLAEDVFPNRRALAEGAVEEERRLFYVALTRARRQLVLSGAKMRKRFGQVVKQQPSRFALEIESRLFAGDFPQGAGQPVPEQKAVRTEQAKSRFLQQLGRLTEPPKPSVAGED